MSAIPQLPGDRFRAAVAIVLLEASQAAEKKLGRPEGPRPAREELFDWGYEAEAGLRIGEKFYVISAGVSVRELEELEEAELADVLPEDPHAK